MRARRRLRRQLRHSKRGKTFGPVVFANRYDGIDLPGDACRLLILWGLPLGTSEYELCEESPALYGGASITRLIAQKVEQGMGRGGRGAGDSCAVVLGGPQLPGWLAKDANLRFLTAATRAQLEMGVAISEKIKDKADFVETVRRGLARDEGWVKSHAETLATLVDDPDPDPLLLELAGVERRAINLWRDGHHEKAIHKLQTVAAKPAVDPQHRGWLLQLAARIADHWGNGDLAREVQGDAFASNKNLTRPRVRPPYRPLTLPGPQEERIAAQIAGYRLRRRILEGV